MGKQWADKRDRRAATEQKNRSDSKHAGNVDPIASLPQLAGNQHMIQLMKAAGQAKQPIQRLVSYGGKLANLTEEEEKDAFKELTEDQKKEVRRQHNDRTNIYYYDSQQKFYDYVKGKKEFEPNIVPLKQEQLNDAKRTKNRRRFYQTHDKIGTPTDNPEFHREEHKDVLPVFYPTSRSGLDKKSLRWTRNKNNKHFELFRSKKLSDEQKQELDEMSLTTVEEEGSDKMHWFANVGRNLASSFTDTDISSRPSGPRQSEYGGETLEDFAEDTTGTTGKHITDREDHKSGKREKDPQLTRGHQQAYKDTITEIKRKKRLLLGSGNVEQFIPSKKQKVATTDEEQEPLPSGIIPSVMSPEQYDIGQHGRRTMIETPSRKEQGGYFEVNELTSDSGTTVGGLDIPGKKTYVKLSKDRKTKKGYTFNQYANVYEEKQNAGGWTNYFDQSKVDMKDVPQQSFYESDEEMEYSDSENEPRTPEFLPQFMKEKTYTSKTELKLGTKLDKLIDGHDDWVVSEEIANTTLGFQYKLTRTDFA